MAYREVPVESHRSPARQWGIDLQACGDRAGVADGQLRGADAAIAGLCDAVRRSCCADVVKAPPWISLASGCGPNVEQGCPVMDEGPTLVGITGRGLSRDHQARGFIS